MMSPTAKKLFAKLTTTGSPDVLVEGAPVEALELVALGYLEHVADRFEVSAKAWQDLNSGKLTVTRVRGLTTAQAMWCEKALSEVGYDTDYDPRETMVFGSTFIEGTREELTQLVGVANEMARLIAEEPGAGYQCDPSSDMPEWMFERVTERAIKCCETVARRIEQALARG
jgi:hypothetical protein